MTVGKTNRNFYWYYIYTAWPLPCGDEVGGTFNCESGGIGGGSGGMLSSNIATKMIMYYHKLWSLGKLKYIVEQQHKTKSVPNCAPLGNWTGPQGHKKAYKKWNLQREMSDWVWDESELPSWKTESSKSCGTLSSNA